MLVSGPDISNITQDDIVLHPTLGMVIHVEDALVAYPTYAPNYVRKCEVLIQRDQWRVIKNWIVCYDYTEYILGEPNPLSDWDVLTYSSGLVGGTHLPIDTTALLLAGVQSISMWMIPVVLVGIGIGVFVIKRRK